MRYAAYRLTGSIALYADALETVINVVAAGGALIALWFSERPADANHPYGHHKAEYRTRRARSRCTTCAPAPRAA